MSTKDYRSKTVDELAKTLQELLKERFTLRMQRGAGLNPKPHLFAINKKNIARLKTVIREKK
ncbi:MAG: 50S ribosomal protein L29 [Gammaproteobacteria bacterium]|nr:50S ribosomal protein L29 [Gammaproteobacteria bacterium]|tara:strand:- start:341 stop:526 length:186 start_codon:yes stop_codon:yes gene_type:complete